MKRFINWLSEHRLANFVILFIYFLAVVLPHKRFGTFLNNTVVGTLGIDNNTAEGRHTYNLVTLSIAAIILCLLLYVFIKNTKDAVHRNRIWGYMIANTILAIIVLQFLFVVNIEFVHYPQYAMFAILSFPLIQNYHQTLIWTTLAGTIDEAYQYFYLAPNDTPYYDMNDVITNLIGAVFGLLFLWSFNIKNGLNSRFFKSSAFYAWVALGGIIAIFCFSGILSIYPSDTTAFQLLKKWPTEFWSKVHPNVTYHITKPLEGTLIVIGLWLFYGKIGQN